jgi:Protein of unknown function (DUF3293)
MGGVIPNCHTQTSVEMAKKEKCMTSPISGIPPFLIRAYREAKFVVNAPAPITLFVGQSNRNLSNLLKDSKVTTAAFITAHNPYSQQFNDAENAKAQASLIADVKNLGYQFIEGYGQDVAEEWPREDSILILGISESQAEALSDKYSQNAFVWIGTGDAYISLRLRRPIEIPSSEDLQSWINQLTKDQQTEAKKFNSTEQAWLMTVSDDEQAHWLSPSSWDLNKPWPLAKPDGSSMGIGTELDRIFKIIAAGQVSIVR